MPYDPQRHQRRTIRLKGHNYAMPGLYYLTICAGCRGSIFGRRVDEAIALNAVGQIVQTTWLWIPSHFSYVHLDAFVVMPDHVHGIIVLTAGAGGNGDAAGRTQHAASLPFAPHVPIGAPIAPQLTPGSLPVIVRAFKSAATREANLLCGTPGATLWQSRYYEHIVRDEDDLARIRRYIAANPMR